MISRYEIYHPDSGLYLLLAKAITNGSLHINIGSETGLYQPMFAAMTAMLSIVFRDLEVAGTVVSIISGSLLTGVVYMFARKLGGMHAAIVAALMAMFYPLLVKFSSLALTETLYTLLFSLTLLAGWVGIEKRCKWMLMLAGGLCGLSYLTRMVGLANLPLLLIWAAWLLRSDGRTRMLSSVSVILVASMLVAMPYIFYLKKMTGSYRVTGQQGLAYYNVAFEGRHSELDGKLNDDATRFRTKELTSGLSLAYLLRTNPGYFVRNFSANIVKLFKVDLLKLLTPAMIAGLILGIYFGLKNSPIFTLYLLSFCLPTLGLHLNTGTNYRYYIPLLAVLIPVAAYGIKAFVDMLAKTRVKSELYRTIIASLIICAALIPFLQWKQDPDSYWVEPQRRAGEWIKEHSKWKNPRVMTREPYIAYFAGGDQVKFPNEPLNRVLVYAKACGTNYIVADSAVIQAFQPNLSPLVDGSPAPEGLKPVFRTFEGGSVIIVYEVSGA